MSKLLDVNIDEPRWDQTTYIGRAKHFFTVTNPRNLLYSSKILESSRDIVLKHRAKQPLGDEVTADDLYRAKVIYDSAFHPITGEKTFILGRMSAQVPMNMFVTGCMMTFYKSTPAVVFWQWVNQSFNALVNYCNRSGSHMPLETIGKSYVLATGGAVATALLLNKMVKKAPPVIGRFVPFAAVAAANCVNIPAMRSKELTEGIKVFDANNNELGLSKVAAVEGTIAVIISRIVMASPSMGFSPILMNALERKNVFLNRRWLEPTIQVLFAGFLLTFATPLACALFVQKAPIKVEKLEPEIQVRTISLILSVSIIW
ncbi:hypothetical protein AAG570_009930 [Ranatra chinensis]|uniref:Sidoreflexin n=1 Tax=Ranatra chinensis TaxID=642074 RepID=A0ABD0YQK3_9HEMI